MKPNPDIALIYHYDLARALAGEVVDWTAIPVNVQAGREGGNLCRLAADFGKRRDLFAMPAPISPAEGNPPLSANPEPGGGEIQARARGRSGMPSGDVVGSTSASEIAAPAATFPVVEQPTTAPVPAGAVVKVMQAGQVVAHVAERDRLRNRVKDLVDAGHAQRIRAAWPDGVPTLVRPGHTPEQLAEIFDAVRRVEAEVGFGFHPDDAPPPHEPRRRTHF